MASRFRFAAAACLLVPALWFAGAILPARAQGAAVEITPSGPDELVASADDNPCPGERDRWISVPDTPVSAYKRGDGSVVMLALNRRNLPLTGATADRVDRSQCSFLLRSGHDSDPAKFNDNEWLVSVLRYPNGTLAAFIHNEYHGYDHGIPGCKAAPGEVQARRCWYGAITYVISRDGGRTFQEPAGSPVVAALNTPFTPETKRVGFGNPKALVDPRDGTPYLLVSSYGKSDDQERGQCLLRGDRNDPSRWRAWDGAGFNAVLSGAYGGTPGSGTCKIVLKENVQSVRFYKPGGFFIAFAQYGRNLVYLTSKDLVTWSAASTMGSFVPFRLWDPNGPAPTQYYSLFDPASSSPSFDTIETRPYLYFIRWRIENGSPVNRKRDLMRQPVAIRPAS